jgi:hypothetical protein
MLLGVLFCMIEVIESADFTGFDGESYHIQTTHNNTYRSIPLYEIKKKVKVFYEFASNLSYLNFIVNPIGIHAGYSYLEVEQMFRELEAYRPNNVIL